MEFDLHGLTLIEAIKAYPEQACSIMQKQAMKLAQLSSLADELDQAVVRRDFATWSGVATKLREMNT